MADVPSFNDLREAARSEALIKPTKFDPQIIDTDGSDVDVVLSANAAMGEEVAVFAQDSFNETHLSTSNGDALDRWVFDRYRLVRQTAQAARVTLTLSRTASTPGVTVPENTAFSTTDGKIFRTVNDVVFPDLSVGPFLVVAVAEETGASGNVQIGSIVAVADVLEDGSIAVTNAEPAAGGADEETDEDLRARAQDFFLTARRGTKEAIEFGATSTPGVQQATANEQLDPNSGLGSFRVSLTISDNDGQANAALAAAVAENLDEFRALGIPVLIASGTPQLVNVAASGLQFEAGVNTSSVLSSARQRVLAAINALAPDETLRTALIIEALQGTDGLIVPSGALTEPSGDLVPSPGFVVRTTLDRIDLN